MLFTVFIISNCFNHTIGIITDFLTVSFAVNNAMLKVIFIRKVCALLTRVLLAQIVFNQLSFFKLNFIFLFSKLASKILVLKLSNVSLEDSF